MIIDIVLLRRSIKNSLFIDPRIPFYYNLPFKRFSNLIESLFFTFQTFKNFVTRRLEKKKVVSKMYLIGRITIYKKIGDYLE